LKKSPETIRIRSVGLVANTEKPESRPLVLQAARLLVERGLKTLADAATLKLARIKLPRRPDVAALAEDVDLLLVFGGDGTILRVARETAGLNTPILGIHVGRLGFLAEVTADQLPRAIDQLAQRDFRIEPRQMLRADHDGKPPLLALNDIVFSRGEVSRMIDLIVAVDGEELTRYRCDGLIVSSPTGSTAYSLAAGGAIVAPDAGVFTITPICPLTLSNRSVIVALDSTITVRAGSGRLRTILTADGQVARQLRVGDEIRIRRANEHAVLLRLGGNSFFQTLRQKLHWSGSHA
jgi:NAD+ kinase